MPYTISPAREVHILAGDATGGGHRFGAGKGKTEFPASWADHVILDAIADVANDPASSSLPARLGRLKKTASRNGISIAVIVDPTRQAVITGYPV